MGTLALLALLVISTRVGKAMLDMAQSEMPRDKRPRYVIRLGGISQGALRPVDDWAVDLKVRPLGL